jgi:hypothetical protein
MRSYIENGGRWGLISAHPEIKGGEYLIRIVCQAAWEDCKKWEVGSAVVR